MASQSGGNKKRRRPANDRASKKYKLNNQVQKNKIKKLERHCKKHPEDTQGKISLERIKKEGYIGRTRPLIPGSNPQRSITYNFRTQTFTAPKTAGEQLSTLLGIPMPYAKPRKKKAKIIRKKQRNVKT